MFSILFMRKLNLREVKELALGHTVNKRKSWDSVPGNVTL